MPAPIDMQAPTDDDLHQEHLAEQADPDRREDTARKNKNLRRIDRAGGAERVSQAAAQIMAGMAASGDIAKLNWSNDRVRYIAIEEAIALLTAIRTGDW